MKQGKVIRRRPKAGLKSALKSRMKARLQLNAAPVFRSNRDILALWPNWGELARSLNVKDHRNIHGWADRDSIPAPHAEKLIKLAGKRGLTIKRATIALFNYEADLKKGPRQQRQRLTAVAGRRFSVTATPPSATEIAKDRPPDLLGEEIGDRDLTEEIRGEGKGAAPSTLRDDELAA